MKSVMKRLLWTELVALALLLFLLYPQTVRYWQILGGLLSFVFLLYIPGYRLSHLFFSIEEIGGFERVSMSLALSFTLAFLSAFYLHYFGIALYPIHIYIITVCTIAIVFGLHMVRFYRKK